MGNGFTLKSEQKKYKFEVKRFEFIRAISPATHIKLAGTIHIADNIIISNKTV